jgi:hypothetical protein
VPPWEDLHELSAAELRLTNLVTTDAVAEVLQQIPTDSPAVPVSELTTAKPVQDRFVSSKTESEATPQPARSTKTAEALVTSHSTAAVTPVK